MSKKKMNNKGFSLMELIIGLAISAVIILAVFSFILVGLKNYKGTNRVTNLQQEVSFVDNMLGEAIRNSSQADVYIINYNNTANGNYEIHTGKKVFYYNKSSKSLYVYDEVAGTNYQANDSDHLVSKYVDDFQIDFKQADNGSVDMSAYTSFDADGNTILNAYSRLVEVKSTYNFKSKTSKSDVTYQIRNK